MAAGATDGPGFLVALGYSRVGAQSGDLVAAGKQQTAGKSQQAQRGGRGRGLHHRASRRSHRGVEASRMVVGTGGMKKAPERSLFGWWIDQSRSPPMMPSKASRLWNTLKMSRYRASVALM